MNTLDIDGSDISVNGDVQPVHTSRKRCRRVLDDEELSYSRDSRADKGRVVKRIRYDF